MDDKQLHCVKALPNVLKAGRLESCTVERTAQPRKASSGMHFSHDRFFKVIDVSVAQLAKAHPPKIEQPFGRPAMYTVDTLVIVFCVFWRRCSTYPRGVTSYDTFSSSSVRESNLGIDAQQIFEAGSTEDNGTRLGLNHRHGSSPRHSIEGAELRAATWVSCDGASIVTDSITYEVSKASCRKMTHVVKEGPG